MQNRGTLHSRLEALEQRLISPLDRRIDALSDADRATYEAWKRECSEHFAAWTGEPGNYFVEWLDGKNARPKLPRHVDRRLFDQSPGIAETDDEETARDKWAASVEQRA